MNEFEAVENLKDLAIAQMDANQEIEFLLLTTDEEFVKALNKLPSDGANHHLAITQEVDNGPVEFWVGGILQEGDEKPQLKATPDGYDIPAHSGGVMCYISKVIEEGGTTYTFLDQ